MVRPTPPSSASEEAWRINIVVSRRSVIGCIASILEEEKSMDKKFKFVKTCLWVGIVLDGINVLLYLWPNLILGTIGLPAAMLTPAAIYLLFHAGIFMLAWTLLLIWTLREPIQRRFILLLTVLVTIGIAASAVYLITIEGIVIVNLLPLLVLPVLVGGLFTAGYLIASSIEGNASSAHGL
jgi:hypothetical protein